MTTKNFDVFSVVNPKREKRVFSDGTPSYSRQISYFSTGGYANVPLLVPEREYGSILPAIPTYLLSRDVSVSLSNIHISVTKTAASSTGPIRVCICEATDEEMGSDVVRFFYITSLVFGDNKDSYEIDVPDIDRVVIHRGCQLCFMRSTSENSEYRFSAILSIDD